MTLLELLVVMVILGLLATLGSIQILSYLDRAKADTAVLQIRELSLAVDLYKLDAGHPPTTSEGLGALIAAPADAQKWRGPYLKNRSLLKDPWGNPYLYKSPGDHGPYDLSTLGADSTAGGEGDAADVGNWSIE